MISALAGCGFTPGAAGEAGEAGSSGNGTGTSGSGGISGASGGLGLSSGGGSHGDVVVTGTGGTTCGTGTVPIMPEPPDVLIVQDKSGSMGNDDTDTACGNGGCGANSKWSQLTAAMTNVIGATQTTVNWGLKYFSDTSPCNASAAPVVTIGSPNAGTAITASLAATTPANNTPTRDAITYGAQYLATLTDTNPKFLLLATDGLPNCPSGCGGMAKPSTMCTMTDNPNEDMAAEAAVTMAAMMGFPTFVVGIGNVTSAQNTLNQFAINGGEAQTGAGTSYYAATDEASLEAALSKIVGMVASCIIPLTGAPADKTNVAISVNMGTTPTKVPEDPTNGWSYTDATQMTIQLNGSYCDGVKSGTYSDVQFVYSCPNGPPICIDRLQDGTCGDKS